MSLAAVVMMILIFGFLIGGLLISAHLLGGDAKDSPES